MLLQQIQHAAALGQHLFAIPVTVLIEQPLELGTGERVLGVLKHCGDIAPSRCVGQFDVVGQQSTDREVLADREERLAGLIQMQPDHAVTVEVESVENSPHLVSAVMGDHTQVVAGLVPALVRPAPGGDRWRPLPPPSWGRVGRGEIGLHETVPIGRRTG